MNNTSIPPIRMRNGVYLFGAAKQTSIGELLLPRIELHFVYVSLVTFPTVIALVSHFRTKRPASHQQLPLKIRQAASLVAQSDPGE